MLRHLLAYIELARPLNAVMAVFGVMVGAVLGMRRGGWTSDAGWSTVSVSLATALILAAGNALNDVCDVEIDRINRPNRPLPSGRLSRQEAMRFACGCALIGWTLAGGVGRWVLGIVVAATGLLLLYSLVLKRMPLGGNLVVGVLTSGVVFVGGVGVNQPSATGVPVLLVFLFTVAREILKDIEDLEGDRYGGAKTAPVCWGVKKALLVATLFTAGGVLLSPMPYAMRLEGFGMRYLLLVLTGVDAVLLGALMGVWRFASPKAAGKAQRWFKFGSAVGLVAVLVG